MLRKIREYFLAKEMLQFYEHSPEVEKFPHGFECLVRKSHHEKISNDVLAIIKKYGSIDGDHHKMWVIDQVVRVLTGANYDAFIAELKAGEDGPETYGWDEGIAP